MSKTDSNRNITATYNRSARHPPHIPNFHEQAQVNTLPQNSPPCQQEMFHVYQAPVFSRSHIPPQYQFIHGVATDGMENSQHAAATSSYYSLPPPNQFHTHNDHKPPHQHNTATITPLEYEASPRSPGQVALNENPKEPHHFAVENSNQQNQQHIMIPPNSRQDYPISQQLIQQHRNSQSASQQPQIPENCLQQQESDLDEQRRQFEDFLGTTLSREQKMAQHNSMMIEAQKRDQYTIQGLRRQYFNEQESNKEKN